MTQKTPMRTIQSMLVFWASGRAERRDAQRVGEAEEERRPHQHEPEEKAPSTKYLRADS